MTSLANGNPPLVLSPEEQERCQGINAALQDQLSSGSLSFSAYMQTALYHESYGYYQQAHCPIGSHGDFITATHLKTFAEAIGMWIKDIATQMNTSIQVIEIGPGRGHLAGHILSFDHDHICAYGLSEYNKRWIETQKKTICGIAGNQALNLITYDLNTLNHDTITLIIANEILDAQPTSRFSATQNQWVEWMVTSAQPGIYTHAQGPLDCHHPIEKMISALDYPEGYTTEFHDYKPHIKSWLDRFDRAMLLIIDYGYANREYFHPQRQDGGLNCYYQHRRYHHPFMHPGCMDISIDVNFSRVAEACIDLNFTLLGYTTQGLFLTSCLAHHNMDKQSIRDPKDVPAQKILMLPHEMGSIFKVMCLGKNLNIDPIGFEVDQSHHL